MKFYFRVPWRVFTHGALLEHSPPPFFPSQLPFLQVSDILSSPCPAHTFIIFLSVSLGKVTILLPKASPSSADLNPVLSVVSPSLPLSLVSPFLLFPPTCQTPCGLNRSSLNFVFPFIHCPVSLVPFLPFLKAYATSAVSPFTEE